MIIRLDMYVVLGNRRTLIGWRGNAYRDPFHISISVLANINGPAPLPSFLLKGTLM